MFLDTSASGMQLLVPYNSICATSLLINATEHTRGCLVSPCLIDFPLTPFFWVVKRRLKNLPSRSRNELRWWLGRYLIQHRTGYFGGEMGWRQCLWLLGNILLEAIIRRRRSRPGIWCPVVLLCLLGMLHWYSGRWRLVWNGLKRGHDLRAHRTQVIFQDKSRCLPRCWIWNLWSPLPQRLPHGAEVMLHDSLWNGKSTGRLYSWAYAFSEYFQFRYWILDPLEVGGYVQPGT